MFQTSDGESSRQIDTVRQLADISETSGIGNVFEMKNVGTNKKQQSVAVVNEHRQSSSLASKLHKPGKSRKRKFIWVKYFSIFYISKILICNNLSWKFLLFKLERSHKSNGKKTLTEFFCCIVKIPRGRRTNLPKKNQFYSKFFLFSAKKWQRERGFSAEKLKLGKFLIYPLGLYPFRPLFVNFCS